VYDEFGLFHENAQEHGLPYARPPVVRREAVETDDGRRISSLVWGEAEPELVLLHGGAQNAHTWDTVALALQRPLLAIDLPGHGHSDDSTGELLATSAMAADVVRVAQVLAPNASGIVGMSLGGLTAIACARIASAYVKRLVLVDVTPGVRAAKATHIREFVSGPESFASFEEMLARTIEHNPTRLESSLRRGLLHNAVQRPDGMWVWRHQRGRKGSAGSQDFTALWEDLSTSTAPLMLVRGMRPQSVVDDADEAELRRRRPDARIEHVEEAGHSVQGDAPLRLAALISDFVFSRPLDASVTPS
jgi:pimeloyl-ACP methyl ester carboxylesterase